MLEHATPLTPMRRRRPTPRAILLDALEKATASGVPDRLVTDVWVHARVVSKLARDLAPLAGVDPVDAAAGGLLHDVGELLLLAAHPATYAAMSDRGLDHRSRLWVEKATFRADHALLAADHLLDHRIPHVIADAVADHHEPFADSDLTTIVVAAADEIADGEPGRRRSLELLGISDDTATMLRRITGPETAPVGSEVGPTVGTQ